MTKEQLEKREAALAEAGYHKTRNTYTTNDYSWFKTVKDPNNPEGWLYMIEWRVWDYRMYIDQNPLLFRDPYTMEPCVLVHIPDECRAQMTYPDTISIEDAERLAKDLYELITKQWKDENREL